MKHLSLFAILLVASLFRGFSQDITLTSGEATVNNDTVYLSAATGTDLMEFKVAVTNNRTTPVSLKVRKTELSLIEGAELSFCWGECYTPFVSVSPMVITIQPAATDRNSFIGEYRPFGVEGTSIARYTFFDPSDTTLSESVTVFFQMGGSGVNPERLAEPSIRMFPNPADREIRVSFESSPEGYRMARLVNLAGQVCLERPVQPSERDLRISLDGIPEGSYFLRLTGQKVAPVTRKVVVRH